MIRTPVQSSIRRTTEVLVVLVVALLLSPAVQAKDNPEDSTRIYTHTYDEVFEAAQKAVERTGCSVTSADKGSGTITGSGKCATDHNCPGAYLKVDFQIKIETVSAKPETHVSVDAKTKGEIGAYGCVGGARKAFKTQLLNETQKVLATY